MLADRMVAAVTAPPVGPNGLEALLRRLHVLPTTPMPTPLPMPIPTELESLLQRLLSGVPAPTPTPPPRTGIMQLESLLQRLLPGMPVTASQTRPGPVRRDWATIVFFNCAKSGHGVGRCPKLNEAFPYMLPGWPAEKVAGNYMMISPGLQRNISKWETATDPGRGVSRPDQLSTSTPGPRWWLCMARHLPRGDICASGGYLWPREWLYRMCSFSLDAGAC